MSRWRARAKQGLSIALVGGLLTWITWQIAKEAATYDWAALRPKPWPLIGSSVLLLVAYLFRAHLWTILVRSMGQPVDAIAGWKIFMGSQLGRYLPGKLWQIAGAGVLARGYGISVRISAVAALISVLLHHLVGGALSALVLSRVSDDMFLPSIAAVGLAVGGLVFVASPLLPMSLRWLGKITRRPGLAELAPPRASLLIALMPGYLLVWLAFAVALGLISYGLFPDLPLLHPFDAIGSMAASAVIGFAVLIAPSGLGVREAVMIALLSPVLGTVAAGVVAIGSRVVMTVTELSISVWGAWPWLRRREQFAPPAAAESSDAPLT